MQRARWRGPNDRRAIGGIQAKQARKRIYTEIGVQNALPACPDPARPAPMARTWPARIELTPPCPSSGTRTPDISTPPAGSSTSRRRPFVRTIRRPTTPSSWPFAPSGTCPLWRDFLKRITNGEDELQAYLQQSAGYALTGSSASMCCSSATAPAPMAKGLTSTR
jgi:hypothetical protein